MRKLQRAKFNGVNIGYEISDNGCILYTIFQNDVNRKWNVYEGDSLSNWIDTYDTLKEIKKRYLN